MLHSAASLHIWRNARRNIRGLPPTWTRFSMPFLRLMQHVMCVVSFTFSSSDISSCFTYTVRNHLGLWSDQLPKCFLGLPFQILYVCVRSVAIILITINAWILGKNCLGELWVLNYQFHTCIVLTALVGSLMKANFVKDMERLPSLWLLTWDGTTISSRT